MGCYSKISAGGVQIACLSNLGLRCCRKIQLLVADGFRHDVSARRESGENTTGASRFAG